jgi:hypothetical protein
MPPGDAARAGRSPHPDAQDRRQDHAERARPLRGEGPGGCRGGQRRGG